jgi:hypothetical protein
LQLLTSLQTGTPFLLERNSLMMKSLRGSISIIVSLLMGTGLLRAQSDEPPRTPDALTSVSGPAATRLAFVQQPTNTAAGASISPAVTVQLKDNSGNDLPLAGVSITLTLSSGTGTLSGTTVRTTSASGLATFSGLSINLVGSKQLRAAATGHVSDSNTFTITPGSAHHVRVVPSLPQRRRPGGIRPTADSM